MAELNVAITNKKLKVYQEIDDLSLIGNYALIYRLFYNLIENSVKYNIEGGTIKIVAHQGLENTEIKISDTGIGIAESDQDKIFDPFYREDPSRNQNIKGQGLGLALVKAIVEKHHGSIHYKSNKPKGSIFKVILPNK